MKSILQSALMYAVVKKLRTLDERTVEILKSYIYVFWLLKISEQSADKKFDTLGHAYDFWKLTLETLQEDKAWTFQHVLISKKLLRLFSEESKDVIERMTAITTIEINLTEVGKAIDHVTGEQSHIFGSALNGNLHTNEDAEIIRTLSQ